MKATSAAIQKWLEGDIDSTEGVSLEEAVREFMIQRTKEAYDAKDMALLPTVKMVAAGIHRDIVPTSMLRGLGATVVRTGKMKRWALVEGDE